MSVGKETLHAEQRHHPGWRNNDCCHAARKTETHVHEGTQLKGRTLRHHDLTPEGRSASCRAYLRGDPMREVGGVGLLPALCRRRTACRRNVLRSRRKMTVSSLPGAVMMRHIDGQSDFPFCFVFLGLTLQDKFHVNQSGRSVSHTHQDRSNNTEMAVMFCPAG